MATEMTSDPARVIGPWRRLVQDGEGDPILCDRCTDGTLADVENTYTDEAICMWHCESEEFPF